MKTNAFNLNVFTKVFLLALSFTFILTSCSDEDETPNPMASSSEVMNIPFFVRTMDGELPSQSDDLLYEFRRMAPVLDPDGNQLTWGEFNTVKGSIDVECTDEGTKIALDLTGLIPNGVYTIWNVTVKAPGFDPFTPGYNMIGLGAAGNGTGSDNKFVATARGTGQIEMVSPGGTLSMMGEIAACSLTDEYEWHVVGAYHIDGNTYGPDLGPDGTATEQFGFIFKNGN